MPNPIPFNPQTMTVNQLTDCVDALRQALDGIERGVDAENIVHNLRQQSEYMARKWKDI